MGLAGRPRRRSRALLCASVLCILTTGESQYGGIPGNSGVLDGICFAQASPGFNPNFFQPNPSILSTVGSGINNNNYFVNNGNGTWTYGYYSSPYNNGNNAGQSNVVWPAPGVTPPGSVGATVSLLQYTALSATATTYNPTTPYSLVANPGTCAQAPCPVTFTAGPWTPGPNSVWLAASNFQGTFWGVGASSGICPPNPTCPVPLTTPLPLNPTTYGTVNVGPGTVYSTNNCPGVVATAGANANIANAASPSALGTVQAPLFFTNPGICVNTLSANANANAANSVYQGIAGCPAATCSGTFSNAEYANPAVPFGTAGYIAYGWLANYAGFPQALSAALTSQQVVPPVPGVPSQPMVGYITSNIAPSTSATPLDSTPAYPVYGPSPSQPYYTTSNQAESYAFPANGPPLTVQINQGFTFAPAVVPGGLQAVVFSYKGSGIAVGSGRQGPVNEMGYTTPLVQSSPTILLTKDQGASWVQATGVPSYTTSYAQLTYSASGPTPLFPFPPIGAPDLFGLACASRKLCWAVGGNGALLAQAQGVLIGGIETMAVGTGSPSAVYTPPADVALVQPFNPPTLTVTGVNGQGQTIAQPPQPPGSGLLGNWGYGPASVLMTTNGGTVWRNIQVTYSQVQLYQAFTGGTIAQVLGSYQPGTLLAVASDTSGRYIWAVGAPPWAVAPTALGSLSNPSLLTTFGYPISGSGSTALYYPPGTTHYVATQPFGTILASTNGGANWALQQPPSLTQYYNYALLALAVTSASKVVAVGGSLNNPQALAWTPTCGPSCLNQGGIGYQGASIYMGPGYGNGIITVTLNGGFSWLLATYPGAVFGTAPCFTTVAFNGLLGMVGGYVYTPGPLQDANGVQQAVLGNAGGSSVLFGNQYSPPASGTNGGVTARNWLPFTTTTYPVNGTIASTPNGASFVTQGLSYTLLLTTDPQQRTWTAYPAQALPPSFTIVGDPNTGLISAGAAMLQNSIKGIVWDTPTHGWIYGISTPVQGYNFNGCGSIPGTNPPAFVPAQGPPAQQPPLLTGGPGAWPCSSTSQTMTSGFILRTYNGGATWDYETPPEVTGAGLQVTMLVNVPPY